MSICPYDTSYTFLKNYKRYFGAKIDTNVSFWYDG
jgi:hypothetical protein